jgi:hypothetical protein
MCGRCAALLQLIGRVCLHIIAQHRMVQHSAQHRCQGCASVALHKGVSHHTALQHAT